MSAIFTFIISMLQILLTLTYKIWESAISGKKEKEEDKRVFIESIENHVNKMNGLSLKISDECDRQELLLNNRVDDGEFDKGTDSDKDNKKV